FLMGFVLIAGCTAQDETTTVIVEPTNEGNPDQSSSAAIETKDIVAASVSTEPEPVKEEKNGIFDLPLSSPPSELMVSVSTDKDPIYNTITVRFDGGRGQGMVRSAVVGVTFSDERTEIQDLTPTSGSTITFAGTSGFDVVEVVVTYMNGASYKVLMEAVGTIRGIIDSVPLEREASAPAPSGDIGYTGTVTNPPSNLHVSVVAEKDSIYKTITITFRGGPGQGIVQKIDTLVMRSDGSTYESTLDSRVGANVITDGTTGTDRVQVVVAYLNGESYKIIDAELNPRGGMASN
ncbi:MAG: hypothetical protein LBV40_00130, partial [Methanomicrobiales archaeon]|nr:hypothetical protein [Methanomicrobiales archaeon]